MIILLALGDVSAQPSGLVPYYFVENEQCTLVLDFQSRRSELVKLSKDALSLSLAKDLLKEFQTNRHEKCREANIVRLLAVFVPGTDNYGRPNFGSRQNLLRLEGSTKKVLENAERDFTAMEQISELSVTVY
jgi:hypothetical protein